MGKDQAKEKATIIIYGCICGWKADKVQLAKKRYDVIVKTSHDDASALAEHDNYITYMGDVISSWQPVIAFHNSEKVMYLKDLQ